MQIIPAMDIMEGKCVRLTQGDYARRKVYHDRPLELAKQFEDFGICRLHLVDLDGARQGRVMNWKVLEMISNKTKLEVDFGGGIKTDRDMEMVFSCGAAIAAIGSMAVTDPELFLSWLDQYGPAKILLGADVRDGRIAIHGWTQRTEILVLDFIRQQLDNGVSQFFCTDIGRDGLLQGPSLELYERILAGFPGLQLIASGGVSGIPDIENLAEKGCSGVIIGKALYEGKIILEDLKPFLSS